MKGKIDIIIYRRLIQKRSLTQLIGSTGQRSSLYPSLPLPSLSRTPSPVAVKAVGAVGAVGKASRMFMRDLILRREWAWRLKDIIVNIRYREEILEYWWSFRN